MEVIIEESESQKGEINKRVEKEIKIYHSISRTFINKKKYQIKINVFNIIYKTHPNIWMWNLGDNKK